MPYDFSIELEVPAKAPPAPAVQVQRDVSKTRALVVDGQPVSRNLLVAQLRDIGIGTIKNAGSPAEARELLNRGVFDFVICESNFPGVEETGHELLEDLRRERMLPYSTIFIMVTAEADYASVRDAAESVVDGYLLRPYSGQNLADRLQEARRRKLALSHIFNAIASGSVDEGIRLSVARVKARESYWRLCARLATELLLQSERLDEVQQLLKSVTQDKDDDKDMAWARLALIRAHASRGELNIARRQAAALVENSPEYVDAYDVLGMLQVDQGDLPAALDTFRKASRLTPGCQIRLQHTGALAFYTGQIEEAIRCLERAVTLGVESRAFDALSLALLALAKHDAGQARGVSLAHEQLSAFLHRHPGSSRLRRMTTLAGGLVSLEAGDESAASRALQRLANEHRSDSFDVEAATLLVALMVRMPQLQPGEGTRGSVLAAVAKRCCVSRVVSEILLLTAGADSEAIDCIQSANAEIQDTAECAVALSARQRPREAIQVLLEAGRTTLNAKLIDMAGKIALRHRDELDDADALTDLISTLQERYCRPVTHLAGVLRTRRQPGAMALHGMPAPGPGRRNAS